MNRSNKKGIALLVVLPIILLTFVLGLYFLRIAATRSDLQSAAIDEIRAKYAIHAAAQLALLEISEIGSLRANVRKGDEEAQVLAFQAMPSAGSIVIGGNPAITLIPYQNAGGGAIRLPQGMAQKEPRGSAVYLAQDLDGDGKIGSVANKAFGLMALNASIRLSENAPSPNPALLTASAASGSAFIEIERRIYFP